MSAPPCFLSALFVRKCLVFSGDVLLLYDHLITFSLEVQYIWKAPWTPVKAGFLLNRYGNAIGQTFIMLEETGYLSQGSQSFCKTFRLYCMVFTIFSGESIRILVLMRAWAIWGCRYRAAVFLIALYVLYVVAVLGVVIYSVTSSPPRPFEYLNQTGVCAEGMPPHIWLMWMATLVLDSIVLAMVWYSLRKLIKESRGLYPSPLIHLLVRDAGLFYATSLFNNVFSIVSWTVFRKGPESFLGSALSFPLLSVVGQRLILNLRGFQARPFTTRDISQEIDRQIEAMGDLLWPDLRVDDEQLNLEQSEYSNTSGTTGTTVDPVELMEVRRSQGSVHFLR